MRDLSTPSYDLHRPDIGLITTKAADTPCHADCGIADCKDAGLHAPSRFRLYLVTLLQRDVRLVGKLTGKDWHEVQRRLHLGLVPE